VSIHDEVVAMLDCGDGLVEIDELGGLVVIHPGAFGVFNRQVRWQFEIKIVPASRGAPILDIVGEGPLPAVEIDGSQALAAFHQRHGNMHCDRGFSGAPLLVSDHDDMRQTTRFDHGVQHGCASKQPVS